MDDGGDGGLIYDLDDSVLFSFFGRSFLVAGELIDYLATLDGDRVNSIVIVLPDGFSVVDERLGPYGVGGVEKGWDIVVDEGVESGQYTLKAHVVTPDDVLVSERSVTVFVKAGGNPFFGFETPPISVVQDRLFWATRKVFRQITTTTNLTIALVIALLGIAYKYLRWSKKAKI